MDLISDLQSPKSLKIEVADIQFRNDHSGWTVLSGRIKDNGRPLIATGTFNLIRSGDSFEIFGDWVEHKKFGKQFRVDRAVSLRPSSPGEILKFLASGVIKGIGPKTAKLIVDHFGAETLNVLDKNPQRLLEVAKIGRKKLGQIREVWDEGKQERDMQLFLSQHDISPKLAAKIVKAYGRDAQKQISENPYRMAMEINGIGFLKADRIAQSVGIASDSTERFEAAILYLLTQASEAGHCFLTTRDIVVTLEKKLNIAAGQVPGRTAEALVNLNTAARIVSRQRIEATIGDPANSEANNDDAKAGGGSAHYLPHLFQAELRLAEHLRTMLQRDDADLPKLSQDALNELKRVGSHLSSTQSDAVIRACTRPIFILTGGPGVGKTTTANAIIAVFKKMGREPILCAPTGRAAQRLAEVGQVEAKTIHRLLEWLPEFNSFSRNSDNPLKADVVIVDEASMLDLVLADALFDALPEKCQLVLIGDTDQLPSVGPGNVLKDLLAIDAVPSVHLHEIFRQSQTSHIVEYAHLINRGQLPKFENRPGTDCIFVEAGSTDAAVEKLLSALSGDFFPSRSLDPRYEVQVITPMNKGELGTQALNAQLQALLNPPSPEKNRLQYGSESFTLGDKVIQTSNNYELGVFNGDIGKIISIEGRRMTVSFGERHVPFKDDDFKDLKLAYAITIHKSQGSEFPALIMLLTMQHYVMLQRNLFYTALTRARKFALIIGMTKALQMAITTQPSLKRRTSLRDWVLNPPADLLSKADA